MTTFLLVRHGETEWNAQGRLQGWRDSRLTEQGRAQAAALAERLAAERVDALVSSDLGRALATAAPIAARLGLEVIREPGLRERSYGVLEGMTWAEAQAAHLELYLRLNARDQEFPVPEGETGRCFRDRVIAAFERLAARHGAAHLVAVTHGGVLGIAYRHANRIALEMPRTFVVPNAGVSRLRVEGRRWTIEAWGATDHLSAPALDDI
jgi:probable phosphoglycerate mutase